MKYRIYCLLLLFIIAGCSHALFSPKWVKEKSPGYFKARFETTDGNFDIEAYRKWSPLAVDRLYQLIQHRYFSNIPVYRVEPNFVAQFGTVDSVKGTPWELHKYADEPVVKTNTTGTMAFAISGPQTRGTQLYINLKDNPKLDTILFQGVKGFPGVAVVTNGMETVNKFYSYVPKVYHVPDSVKDMAKYYRDSFPKMGYITKAYLIK